MSKYELYLNNEKWYKQQWLKISIKYAVPDLLKQIKSYFF